ncbi:unnamed protein product (macronuclear) [Paramecium tetraurelia]|uniref:B box-type domain-containing protein n=1 Tax=Paramecium tetraurelia TaxID=5888 RepID=A0EC02_PARTE|nr:uncharacterized protein GSPATT00025555001 [Paramecium tetraurelia]CAK92819.1 unnamed protein product [Paramecium tetraurelia]|eukprot:XP_001460216.1 hypothetical protein (macronuclear) [Paramecium tetraurelia strain d4-2]
MSSLFVQCMACKQRPATIKCSECKPGQIYCICYACNTQVHNKKGPIDSQHITEIMSYQEMNIKSQSAAGIRNKQLQSKPELKQKPIQQQIQYQQPQPQASAQIQQFVTSQKMGKFDLETKNIQSSKPNSTSNKEVPKVAQVSQGKSESLQQLTKIKHNYIGRQEDSELPSDQSKELAVQVKREQENNKKLQIELQQTKDQLQNINKEVEKIMQYQLLIIRQQNQKDLEKKINDLKKQYHEDKKKTEQLSEDVKKLKEQLKTTDLQTNKKLDQQKKLYEQQVKQLEDVAQEKQDQILEIAHEFQNYNFEEIQAKMEEMENENNQKDQLILELQNQLQEKNSGSKQNDNQESDENWQIQLEEKDQEILKLEEIIENFKQLYQHMLDEKQVLADENEKLVSENNQFRELFNQNLHLFGINPDDLEGGDEEETGAEAEAEDYRQHDDYEG